MNMLSLTDRIAHGLQSYKDYCNLCTVEEYPEWVVDVAMAVNTGDRAMLNGKNYDDWVYGVFDELIKENKNSQSDGR